MQRPIAPVSNYGRSGGVLLINPTDRDLAKNYALPSAGTATARGARRPEVIRYPVPPTFIGGTAPATATLSALNPATAVHGGADFTLVCAGSGFVPGTAIIWNGHPEVTTFTDASNVSTGVKPSLVSAPVTVQVAVQNPGEVPTATRTFTFT